MRVYCHCGKPLHYTKAAVQAMVEDLIRQRGLTIRITVDGRTWLVPRHFLALHGLRAEDLPTLGFEEEAECGPQQSWKGIGR